MSGILGETLVSLKDACGLVPGRKKLGLPTIQRWRLDGVRGVRLETTLVAGRRFTSREAIERFLESVNRAADGEALPSGVRQSRRAGMAEAAQVALRAELQGQRS